MMRRDFITLNAYGPRGRGAAAGGTGTAASEVAGHRVLGFGVPKTCPCGPIWIPPLSKRGAVTVPRRTSSLKGSGEKAVWPGV